MAEAKRADGRARRILQRLAVLLGTLIIALLLAEGGLRLFGVRPPRWPETIEDTIHEPVDRPLEWKLKPGTQGRWHYFADAYSKDREVFASVNELGWRGPAVPKQKQPGKVRIACLGDSLTFGTGCGEDETWPAQVGGQLSAELGPDKVEMLNWGVAGYDTAQEIALLELWESEYSPDVVVLAYFVNDAQDPASATPEPLDPIRRAVIRVVKDNTEVAWSRRLRSVSWLAEMTAQMVSRKILWMRRSMAERLYYQEGNPGWVEVRDALRRGRDLCERRGIEFLVALYPPLQRGSDGALTSAEIHDIIAEFCRAEGIACLDLQEAFADKPVETMWIHSFDMHPNGAANRIAAEAIARRLLADGMIKE